MPYWDVTYDASLLSSSSTPDATTIPILDSQLGGNGNMLHNHCVEEDLWNVDEYWTEFLCATNEQTKESPDLSPRCCLKREVHSDSKLPAKSEWTESFRFRRFRDFQDAISDFHGSIHKLFAATPESHMYANNAAEDPLFVLLHSFLDLVRFQRQKCWHYDFEGEAIDSLEDYLPFAFDAYLVMDDEGDPQSSSASKAALDDPMRFEFVCNLEGAFCAEEQVTIRKMYDFGAWNVSFEPGPFWNDNLELQSLCGDLSALYHEGLEYGQSEELIDIVSVHEMNEKQNYLRNVFNWWMFNVVAIGGIVSVVWLLIRRFVPLWIQSDRPRCRKTTFAETEDDSIIRYGTV